MYFFSNVYVTKTKNVNILYNWISAKSALSEFQNIFHAITANIIHKILTYT